MGKYLHIVQPSYEFMGAVFSQRQSEIKFQLVANEILALRNLIKERYFTIEELNKYLIIHEVHTMVYENKYYFYCKSDNSDDKDLIKYNKLGDALNYVDNCRKFNPPSEFVYLINKKLEAYLDIMYTDLERKVTAIPDLILNREKEIDYFNKLNIEYTKLLNSTDVITDISKLNLSPDNQFD